MHSLHRFLVDYDMAMLRALAQARGTALTTNRQAEAVDRLALALLTPLSVQVAVAHLSSQAREALDALLAAGGRMRTLQFARRFGQVRPVGPGRLEREAPWQNPANPTEELYYLGLIFRSFDQDEAGPGEFVTLPDDLLPLLPPPRTGPAIFCVDTVAAPANSSDGEQALALGLFTYLVYLQNRDVRPHADGRLGRRDLANLSGRLADPDERRLGFLRHLAARLGCVVQQDNHLRLETAPVKRWLTASTATQMADLQEAWRDDPTWNDLRQVPALAFDPETDWHLQNDPVTTRLAILAVLARCPVESWWSLTSFVAAIKEAHPDFLRPDGDYTSWYIRDAASGTHLSGFESWDRVEGELLADLLTRPLCWLGIVTVGTGDVGSACRLTKAGAHFLGLGSDEPEALPSPPIAIGADLSIDLLAPVNLYTRFQLERFADLASADPCRYRLTVDGLGRALARGLRVEQVLAFLQQASASPVPANVASQLRLWTGRFDSVRLEEVALLRVQNERVLKELTILPETRSLIARVLSPTSAVVRQKDLHRLRKELHALGYLRRSPDDD